MFDEKDPQACYEILSSNPSALLVDCRAQIEWEFVGTPDLGAIGKKALLVEWTNSAHQRNPDLSKAAGAIILYSLSDLSVCIHHKRPHFGNRLTDRLTRHNQTPCLARPGGQRKRA